MGFREYLLEEGDFLDAVRCGYRAFQKKRQEQKQTADVKAFMDKLLSAEGQDLKALIQQLVAKQPLRTPQRKKMSKEVLEHVRTQKRNTLQKVG